MGQGIKLNIVKIKRISENLAAENNNICKIEVMGFPKLMFVTRKNLI